MKVTKIQVSNPIFTGKIIDSHTHIGKWAPDNADFTAKNLGDLITDSFENRTSGTLETDEVEKTLTSSLTCLDRANGKPVADELTGNKQLLDDVKFQSKIKPLAVCQPGSGEASNIEKLLTENPDSFYGFKFHPNNLEIDPNDTKYEPYLKLAESKSMPIVFHSDRVGSFADPNSIYDAAKKIPKVPIVLYHMSLAPAGKIGDLPAEEISAKGLVGKESDSIWDHRELWNQDGINVVKKSIENKDANLYLDVSWTKPQTVVTAINEVGADRVLFGTDTPLGPLGNRNYYVKNILDIKQAIVDSFGEKSGEIIEKVFYKNAQEIFFDKNWAKAAEEKAKQVVEEIKNEVNASTNNGEKSTTEAIIDTGAKTAKKAIGKGKIFTIAFGALALVGGAVYMLNKNKNK